MPAESSMRLPDGVQGHANEQSDPFFQSTQLDSLQGLLKGVGELSVLVIDPSQGPMRFGRVRGKLESNFSLLFSKGKEAAIRAKMHPVGGLHGNVGMGQR